MIPQKSIKNTININKAKVTTLISYVENGKR